MFIEGIFKHREHLSTNFVGSAGEVSMAFLYIDKMLPSSPLLRVIENNLVLLCLCTVSRIRTYHEPSQLCQHQPTICSKSGNDQDLCVCDWPMAGGFEKV